MNSSGVFRKIDELGRIVIPVEIRKYLNINEGEFIEFNIKDNNIILNKKSVIGSKFGSIKEIFLLVSSIIDENYIISDREKVLLSSNKSLVNENIDGNLLKFNGYQEYYEIYDDIVKNTKLYVFPYFYEGSIVGLIILYNINDVSKYLKLMKFVTLYINERLSIS